MHSYLVMFTVHITSLHQTLNNGQERRTNYEIKKLFLFYNIYNV